MNHSRLFSLVSAGILLSAPAQARQLDAARIGAHVDVLASDAFEGRAPASAGEAKTVAYVSEQFKAAGLQPGGDLKNGPNGQKVRAWTQDVPLARFQIVGAPNISVMIGGKSETFTQGEQVAIRPSATGQTEVDVKNLPIVFAGYGVTAPQHNWDDFKGIDVKGKLVLVLANEPNFETGQGDLGGSTPYGRYDYKVEQAARRGAAGILVIRDAAWAAARTSNTHEIMDFIRPDPAKTHTPVEGWIQAGIAANLLNAAGLDGQALKRQAQTRTFKPVQLKGVTFSSRFTVDARKVVSHNVIGVWPGTTHPDESIVYSAHWDHLGVGQPDAQGDRIYNGALDNATGTALLMELGRAFAEGPRLGRSVVFLAAAAEEKGLLGSAYYAAHPSFPLALTVGDINLDSIYPVGPSRNFTTIAAESNNLVDNLIAAGQRHGMTYTRTDSGSSFFGSDHFSFLKAGVPAISVHIGADLVDGGPAALDAWFAENRGVYHQPSDEVRAGWRYDGPASFGSMLLDAGTALANSRTWPALAAGVKYKAERDKTAAARKN